MKQSEMGKSSESGVQDSTKTNSSPLTVQPKDSTKTPRNYILKFEDKLETVTK
jgi:hypothetical protein